MAPGLREGGHLSPAWVGTLPGFPVLPGSQPYVVIGNLLSFDFASNAVPLTLLR